MSETTNTVSVENVVAAVMAQFGNQVTAGQIAKAATAVAAVLGVQTKDGKAYVIKQQMTTNYLRNGAFDGIKRESAAGVTISAADVEAWLTKYFNKVHNGIVVGSSKGASAASIADKAREMLNLKVGMAVEVDDEADETGEDIDA